MTDRVHDFLIKPRKIRAQIRQTQSQIDGLRLSMLPGAIRYDKDRVQSSIGEGDQLAEYAARLTELEHELDLLRGEYLDAQDAIVDASSCLTEDDYGATIILMRYISEVDFSDIADEIGMTRRHMFRYYKTALENLDKYVSECH